MVRISPKQRRIVEAKARGLTNQQIAEIEYPNATVASQGVLVSRELHKPNVAQYEAKVLGKLLEAHNVTKSQYIKNIGEAMQAEKMNSFTGEVTPDYTTRLSANKQAERFLKFETEENEEKRRLGEGIGDLSDMNEVELTKAVFRKKG